MKNLKRILLLCVLFLAIGIAVHQYRFSLLPLGSYQLYGTTYLGSAPSEECDSCLHTDFFWRPEHGNCDIREAQYTGNINKLQIRVVEVATWIQEKGTTPYVMPNDQNSLIKKMCGVFQ